MTGRIGRNMGRVELYAVLEKVKALQEAGYDFKKIHAQLAAAGLINMSYSTFCFQMTKLAERQGPSRLSAAGPQPSPAVRQQTEQRTSSNKTGLIRQGRDVPFTVDKSPDLKDFI